MYLNAAEVNPRGHKYHCKVRFIVSSAEESLIVGHPLHIFALGMSSTVEQTLHTEIFGYMSRAISVSSCIELGTAFVCPTRPYR